MPSTPVAQALVQAHRERFTGFVRVLAAGRISRLAYREGDLVDAQLGFGHQTAAQALLQEWRLAPEILDGLWARGAPDLDDAALKDAGVERVDAEVARALATVRRMVEVGEEVELERAAVEPRWFVSGERAAHEALQLVGGSYVPAQPQVAEPVIAQEQGAESQPSEISEAQVAEAMIAAEPVTAEPVTAEPVAAEPVAAEAIAEAEAAEPQIAEAEIAEMDIAEPQLAEPGLDASDAAPAPDFGVPLDWAELVPPAVPEPPADVAPPVEAAAEVGDPSAPSEPLPPSEPTWEDAVPDEAALAAARQAAQHELTRQMNEALRRAGAAPVDAWLAGEVGDLESLTVPTAALAADADEPVLDALELSIDAPSDSSDDALWTLIGGVGSPHTPADADDFASSIRHTDDELAEEWHIEEDLAGEPSDPVEAARLRRQRLIRRAMENMGTLPRPREPVMNAQTVAPPEPPQDMELTPAHTVDERKLAKLIDERYSLLGGKRDHFKVLGLTEQATKEQVKSAFLQQAKTFHPDRLPASLAPLTPKMSAIFEAIREAYETLYDDTKRAGYLHRVAVETAQLKAKAPDVETRAADEYRKAEASFRKRDWVAAEAAYARAHSLDPKAEYLAGRAWALYMDPARKRDAGMVRQMLHDALKANPECDRAHYQLGVLARVENDIASAERHFRDAMKANPRHLEAAQEVRLIDMRKKKGKKGLFG